MGVGGFFSWGAWAWGRAGSNSFSVFLCLSLSFSVFLCLSLALVCVLSLAFLGVFVCLSLSRGRLSALVCVLSLAFLCVSVVRPGVCDCVCFPCLVWVFLSSGGGGWGVVECCGGGWVLLGLLGLGPGGVSNSFSVFLCLSLSSSVFLFRVGVFPPWCACFPWLSWVFLWFGGGRVKEEAG